MKNSDQHLYRLPQCGHSCSTIFYMEPRLHWLADWTTDMGGKLHWQDRL